ncbi:MAG: Gfo/Idh/MocA family oxidoreductase [Acidobacteriota bacterium]|nr:Gfo/Idh/MocA family oxidoreductase [Acidobacteriota bacterium]MDH3528369.1 Gfo/Idh/MocA family oxidoreductase [Acidobacteriota bacterium]
MSVRWGIIGAANIAVKKVIPAMQAGEFCEISAIASRDIEKAERVAKELNIPKAFGSYEQLLADPDIDAVYNPLPNNLHLEWTVRAAEAGKHVLCEKPLGLNAGEVRRLIEVRDRTNVKIQEAFMIRDHPTWISVRELIGSGRIGELRAVSGFFSYFNVDRSNIRNKSEMGGGALLDIGCYCINTSRFVFGSEPVSVAGFVEGDREMGIDRLSSAMLRFPNGHSVFTCSTQLVPFQRMYFLGTSGRIEVQIPFNIPTDTPTRLFVDDGSDLYGENIETIEFEPANQYTIQGDLFSRAIKGELTQVATLEDSFLNMAALDAVFRSATSGKMEEPERLRSPISGAPGQNPGP